MSTEYFTLKTFPSRLEADQAYELLQSAGIQSVLKGDDASGWFPYIGLGTGGISIFVNPEDADKARQVLADYGI